MDYSDFRVSENLRMHNAPQLAQASGPRFISAETGQPLTVIPCGVPYILEVPGYSQAYFTVTKDGVEVLRDVIPLPQNYVAVCPQDVARYVVTAYDLATGSLIGTTQADVVEPTAGEGGPGFLSSITPGMWLTIGSLALLMFRRKR